MTLLVTVNDLGNHCAMLVQHRRRQSPKLAKVRDHYANHFILLDLAASSKKKTNTLQGHKVLFDEWQWCKFLVGGSRCLERNRTKGHVI